jgi:NTP-dependent ternary system trypsin peptidase co-occuring protein
VFIFLETGALMAELVRFSVAGDRSVLVEIPSPDGGLVPAGGKRNRIVEATSSFSEHLDAIRDAMEEALDKFREMNPEEAKISFGISFSAEAGAVIARTALGANIEVELTWHRTDKK